MAENLERTDLYNMNEELSQLFKEYPWLEQTYEELKTPKEEGFILYPRSVSYTDRGTEKEVIEPFLTGGYGQKLDAKDTEWKQILEDGGEEKLKEYWEQRYAKEFPKKAREALTLLNMDKVDSQAAGIVVKMVYQMGKTGVQGFKKTLKHINNGHYKEASTEMLQGSEKGTMSKWANQTHDRAMRASNRMAAINDE